MWTSSHRCLFTSLHGILGISSDVGSMQNLSKWSCNNLPASPRSCLPGWAFQLCPGSSVVLVSVGTAELASHCWSPGEWGSVHPPVHCGRLQWALWHHSALTEPLLPVHYRLTATVFVTFLRAEQNNKCTLNLKLKYFGILHFISAVFCSFPLAVFAEKTSPSGFGKVCENQLFGHIVSCLLQNNL